MFRLKLTSRAKKELKLLTRLHQLAIASVLEEIKDDPSLGKLLTRELTNKYSYRVGVYRVIYLVNYPDETIVILTAGHRGTVYD